MTDPSKLTYKPTSQIHPLIFENPFYSTGVKQKFPSFYNTIPIGVKSVEKLEEEYANLRKIERANAGTYNKEEWKERLKKKVDLMRAQHAALEAEREMAQQIAQPPAQKPRMPSSGDVVPKPDIANVDNPEGDRPVQPPQRHGPTGDEPRTLLDPGIIPGKSVLDPHNLASEVVKMPVIVAEPIPSNDVDETVAEENERNESVAAEVQQQKSEEQRVNLGEPMTAEQQKELTGVSAPIRVAMPPYYHVDAGDAEYDLLARNNLLGIGGALKCKKNIDFDHLDTFPLHPLRDIESGVRDCERDMRYERGSRSELMRKFLNAENALQIIYKSILVKSKNETENSSALLNDVLKTLGDCLTINSGILYILRRDAKSTSATYTNKNVQEFALKLADKLVESRKPLMKYMVN